MCLNYRPLRYATNQRFWRDAATLAGVSA